MSNQNSTENNKQSPPQTKRTRLLAAAVSDIEKQFGKGALMRLGEGAGTAEGPVISTGSIGLDIALGIGGAPRGRVVEVYGPASSGKTTLALHAVADAQRLGRVRAFIVAQQAL